VSDEIDDDSTAKVDVGLMSMGMLDLFRQCATTSQFTPKGGSKLMSSALLYPFYGGKSVPDKLLLEPGWAVTEHNDAAEVYGGQSAVVIVNTLSCAVKVTRPYRDGGYMIILPKGTDGVDNHIDGRTTIDGTVYFGVGGYINDTASIFYGSGAVLFITPDDGAIPAAALAYGASVNGGVGLAVAASASDISDPEKWFSKTADHDTFTAGNSVSSSSLKLKITASVASWDNTTNTYGGVFTVLLEHS
jgi:hypothetical protein